MTKLLGHSDALKRIMGIFLNMSLRCPSEIAAPEANILKIEPMFMPLSETRVNPNSSQAAEKSVKKSFWIVFHFELFQTLPVRRRKGFFSA